MSAGIFKLFTLFVHVAVEDIMCLSHVRNIIILYMQFPCLDDEVIIITENE
jgi:hypothetical protein